MQMTTERTSKAMITSEVRTITPNDAAEMLGRNTRNYRPMSVRLVSRLSQSMRAGHWELNGEAITLFANGDIADGQHRLAAIVQCGVPITTVVITGIESDRYIDTGKKRTRADLLRSLGEKNVNVLSACLSVIHAIESNDSSGSMSPMFDNGMMLEVLERHPGIREFTRSAGGRLGILGGLSVTVALMYLFSLKDAELADDFMETLVSGVGPEADPALLLRDRFMRDRLNKGTKMSRRMRGALCIKAWNAYRTSTPLRTLMWRLHGKKRESFPEII